MKTASIVQTNNWLKSALLVLGASSLIGLVASLSIRLPFTPIPLVFTSQVILFLSVLFGPKRATAMMLLYLLQGALGLPVFANGGSGLLYMLGPTGGYLVGYLAAAFAAGYLGERVKSKLALFNSMLVANSLIFIFGVPHLSLFLGWEKAIALGCLPFLALDLLKTTIAFVLVDKVRSRKA